MSHPGLSLQLYTVRDAVAADLPGTLRRIAAIGFRDIEPWGFAPREAEFAAAFAETGLSAPSAHAPVIASDDPAALFASARRLGVQTLIDPHYPGDQWSTREAVEAIAAKLNELAKVGADAGVAFGYHNHWFELEPRLDGVPALEVLADLLDDDVVLEVDTYWAQVGGVDPVGLLQRLGERVRFIHVKDGPPSRDPADQVAVGDGGMDIAGILAAAPQARRVAELDDTRGDIWTAVERSYAALAAEAEGAA